MRLITRHCLEFVLVILATATLCPADEPKPNVIEGTVVKVQDGDTITILDADKREHRIRLAQIDAPERGQEIST